MTLQVRVWKDGRTEVVELQDPTPDSCSTTTLNLRCLPGASAIQVVVAEGADVKARAEIAADPDEVVPVSIDVDGVYPPYVWSRSRPVLHLTRHPRFDPAAVLQPHGPDAPVDIAVVVDGTLRAWPLPEKRTENSKKNQQEKSTPLLESAQLRGDLAGEIVALLEPIVEGRDARVAVLAFGDQEMPAVSARDLRPAYVLHPAENQRGLRPFDDTLVRRRIEEIPATSGGDFVDALADALAAARKLPWRMQARKLVIVIGDSPGASVLHPLPKGADLCVRSLDVDVEAMKLHCHEGGVAIVTIYRPPRADLGLYALPRQRDLIGAAQDQYRRLASLPKFAFETPGFHPDEAARVVLGVSVPIARGAALGELVS